MKSLIVLLTAFAASLLIIKIGGGSYEFALSGRIALSVMLIYTAIGHFVYTKGMSYMIPGFFPFKTEIVYMTGIIEILFAIGLLIPKYRILIGCLLIVYLILLLPANLYGAIRHLDIESASFDGKGLGYLFFRIPLQLLFIVWIYLCDIRY